MTRKAAREIAVRICFWVSENIMDYQTILDTFFDPEYYASLSDEDELCSEYPDEKQKEYIERVIRGIGEHSAELDSYIEKYSVGWKFSRISRTALAIMKTAMFEILYMQDIPDKVAANEAVELAKVYEEPETVPFINGILASFIKGEKI